MPNQVRQFSRGTSTVPLPSCDPWAEDSLLSRASPHGPALASCLARLPGSLPAWSLQKVIWHLLDPSISVLNMNHFVTNHKKCLRICMCKNPNPFIDVLIRQSSGDTLHSLVCFLAGGHQGLPQPRQGPDMKRTRGTRPSTHTGCWLNLTRCSPRSVNVCPGVFLSSFIFSLYRSYTALSCLCHVSPTWPAIHLNCVLQNAQEQCQWPCTT